MKSMVSRVNSSVIKFQTHTIIKFQTQCVSGHGKVRGVILSFVRTDGRIR